jgi:integrase
MTFTETWLKTVQPRKVSYRISEKGSIKGFGIQVTPKGSVSFILCFQKGTKAVYRTLGQHPDMSLAAARDAAREFRANLAVHQEDEPPASVGNLSHLCDAYLEDLRTKGSRSVQEIERIFKKDVLTVLNPDKPAAEVTSYDIRVVMNTCQSRGAGVQANRLRSYLSAAFAHGIRHDNDSRNLNNLIRFGLSVNPVAAVPPVSSYEVARDRVLSMEELAEVWNYRGDNFSPTHLVVLKLITLFGGLRPSEVTQARVDEFDFENKLWNIPPTRTKNKRWHVLPVTELAETLIKSAIMLSPGHSHVFPNSYGGDRAEHTTSFGHAVKRVVDSLGMEKWSPRDLRRTCKTWSGHAGLSKEIRDRLQNHALTDVSAKHYDRYLYLREKREALELWESWLLPRLVR